MFEDPFGGRCLSHEESEPIFHTSRSSMEAVVAIIKMINIAEMARKYFLFATRKGCKPKAFRVYPYATPFRASAG
jgi:hypothetical protein